MGTTLGNTSSLSPSPAPVPRAPIPVRCGAGEGLPNLRHLAAIVEQHEHNCERWNGYECTPAEHLLIATEELGEVARAMQTNMLGYQWPPAYNEDVYRELVDLGAVVLAMMKACESAL